MVLNMNEVVQNNCKVLGDMFRPRKSETIAWPYINIALCVAITLTNIILLIALHKTKQTKTKSSRLFITLVFTDLSVGVFTMPTVSFLFFLPDTTPNFCLYAAVLQIATFLPILLSLLLTLLIALERYLTVLHRKDLTWRAICFYVTCCVLFSLLVSVSRAFFSKLPAKIYEPSIHVFLFVSLELLAICIVSILYTRLLLYIRRTNKRSKRFKTPSTESKPKTIRTIAYLLASLVCIYLTNTTLLIYVAIFTTEEQTELLRLVIPSLGATMYLNSLINPVIVIYSNRQVKDYIRQRFLKRTYKRTTSSISVL